jgi:hypothetical protein
MAKTYTAANTAASNTTNDTSAYNILSNSTTGMAATNSTVGTINTNVNTINTNTAPVAGESAAYWANQANSNATTADNNTTYNGQSAAYWANQAATAATSNIVPVISSVIGQNGATCTTSSSFVANVAVSPASSITYAVTGVPSYTVSGNSITFTGLSSGAYTAIITATYTPTGKTCTLPFTFFKI